MVEKSVGIFKKIFKKNRYDENKLWYSLLEYRNSPLEGIKLSPAQLLLNRRLKTNKPVSAELLEPEIFETNKILNQLVLNREKQEKRYNVNSRERDQIKLGNAKYLYVRYNGTWNKAENLGKSESPRSYRVKLLDGTVLIRNSKWLKLIWNDNTGEGSCKKGEYGEVERDQNRISSKRTSKNPNWLNNFV